VEEFANGDGFFGRKPHGFRCALPVATFLLPLRGVPMGLHRVLFAGITVAVWMGHRRALRAGGYDFGRFWRAAWGKMRFAWRAMSPRAYSWTEQPRPNETVSALPDHVMNPGNIVW
jgi:hypothetical protein